MEETEFDRILRFANAIANDIEDDEGGVWGPELVERFGDEHEVLLGYLEDWLQRINFSEEDAKACISLATVVSFSMAYSSGDPTWGKA